MSQPPTDLDGVTVVQDFYVQTGDPIAPLAALTGKVTFSSTAVLNHVNRGPWVLNEDIVGTVTDGHLEQYLLISNDPQWQGVNTYAVSFALRDPGGGRINTQPSPFTLTLDASLIGQRVELRTLLPYDGSTPGVPLVTAFASSLLLLAADPDLLVSGTVVYDSHGAAVSAPITWPDGVVGVYTGTASTTFPGLVDAYTLTHGTKTYSQPAVTRNASGSVTSVPPITVT